VYKQSLFDLEVGDELAALYHYKGNNYWVKRKVVRVTKTQVVVNNQNDNSVKYWKKDGEKVGSKGRIWHSKRYNTIHVLDEKYINKIEKDYVRLCINIRKNDAIAVITKTNFRNLPLDKLEKIAEIIKVSNGVIKYEKDNNNSR